MQKSMTNDEKENDQNIASTWLSFYSPYRIIETRKHESIATHIYPSLNRISFTLAEVTEFQNTPRIHYWVSAFPPPFRDPASFNVSAVFPSHSIEKGNLLVWYRSGVSARKHRHLFSDEIVNVLTANILVPPSLFSFKLTRILTVL